MSKASLQTQTGKLFIVIRKNKAISEDKIKAYCMQYGDTYAFISHKQDIDPITGIVIPIHYHIVLNAKDKRKRLATHLEDLRSFFGFKNNDGIEIDKYRSYESALQYLIHKNDPQKTQHTSDEIITNIDKGELATLLTCDETIISFELILALVHNSSRLTDVIRSLGISNYQRYRATILDIWREEKGL